MPFVIHSKNAIILVLHKPERRSWEPATHALPPWEWALSYRHPSGNPFQLCDLQPHPLGNPQGGTSVRQGQRPMGQDIVARDKVELHSSCVVLEGQEALPHDGVLLPSGNKQK